MNKYFHFKYLVTGILFSVFIVAQASAQSIWQDYSSRNSIHLEILKAQFDDAEYIGFLTTTSFLTGRFSVSQKFRIVGELPFSYYDYDREFARNRSESKLGNPYVGAEFWSPGYGILIEFGARIPVVSDQFSDAVYVGVFTDRVERIDAFIADIIPVSFFTNYIYEHKGGFALRLRAGPSIWISKGERDESEVYILYSAQTYYKIKRIRLGAGLSGRLWATVEDADFSERTWHQLGFSLDVRLGMFLPAAYLRFPLDEGFRDFVDYVFGIGLGFNFD